MRDPMREVIETSNRLLDTGQFLRLRISGQLWDSNVKFDHEAVADLDKVRAIRAGDEAR